MKLKIKIALYWAFFGVVYKRAKNISLIHASKVDKLKKVITRLEANEKKSLREMVHPAQMEVDLLRYLEIPANETGRELIQYLQQPWAKLNLDVLARKIPFTGHNVS